MSPLRPSPLLQRSVKLFCSTACRAQRRPLRQTKHLSWWSCSPPKAAQAALLPMLSWRSSTATSPSMVQRSSCWASTSTIGTNGGWHDRFSSSQYTDRQSQYSARLKFDEYLHAADDRRRDRPVRRQRRIPRAPRHSARSAESQAQPHALATGSRRAQGLRVRLDLPP